MDSRLVELGEIKSELEVYLKQSSNEKLAYSADRFAPAFSDSDWPGENLYPGI